MEKPYLSVIIPCYNEADRLPLTLIEMDKYFSTVDYSYELLVMNDGSRDATADVAKKMAATIKNLVVIDNTQNKGKGGVVRQGMLAAQGEIRLFADADNATPIEQFEKMRPFFKEGYEVVIGSRAIKGSIQKPAEPWYRQLAGKGGNLMIQLINLPGIWDTQCGFKAFTAKAAAEIFTASRIRGFGFDIECLTLARKFGYKIKEIPVLWINKAQGTVHAGDYLKVFLENLKIRWWILTGVYNKKSNREMAN